MNHASTIQTGDDTDTDRVLSYERIVDGSKINVPMHKLPDHVYEKGGNANDEVQPVGELSTVGVDIGTNTGTALPALWIVHVFAERSDAHRDFPFDTLACDETYTITAWAPSTTTMPSAPWPARYITGESSASLRL